MKTLFLIFILLISSSVFAQKSHDELLQDFLKQRKAMMEQMMKAFNDDDFFKDDFDDDGMFEALKQNGLQGFRNFHSQGGNVKIEEKAQQDGSIDVLITPQNENIKLDIQTKNNMITVKSETMEKVENQDQGGNSSSSMSRSSTSQMVRIPNGFTAQNPVQEGKTIKISLIPESGKKSIIKTNYPKGVKPIGKAHGEDTI